MIVKNTPILSGFLDSDIVNLLTDHSAKKSVFLDIETTGFAPLNSQIYMVGTIYFSENKWVQTQWMAETFDEEWEVLDQFFRHFSGDSCLITYNGDHFDLPYLEKKRRQSPISRQPVNFSSLDLYKFLKPYKKMLNFSRMRQSDLEKFLDFNRCEDLNGRDYISIYQQYLKTNDLRLAEILLDHNQKDLQGLTKILSLLSYAQPAFGHFQILEASLERDYLHLAVSLLFPLPRPLSYRGELLGLEGEKEQLHVTLPLTEGKLRKFYSDFQSYYYLPGEDMAIHQSLAAYIDKEKKKKATAETCYTWFDCTPNFVSDFDALKTCLREYFQLEFKGN